MKSNHFTKIVKDKLADKNLSSLSRKLGINKAILHDWVKSERLPSLKNIKSVKILADYLGLTLEQLLIGEEGKEIKSKSLVSISFMDDDRKYELEIRKIDKS